MVVQNKSAPWRPEFLAALRVLAKVSDAMAASGLGRPVLVGGGAVEFYTGSAVMTGDIDLTSPIQPELEEEMQRFGFIRPTGPGKSLRGWIHPELGLGFEVVGSSPMGGAGDPTRVRLVRPIGETARFRILPVEDLIADRMGQFASGSAPEMRGQAQALMRLYPDLDRDYLEERIREETLGDHGIGDIEG
ncbi:MAG TPA: hypothetical protein VJ859_13100 [Allosphingosinicella sp.]|nr:hypothetical protein [Allosphingosinicella sp.]